MEEIGIIGFGEIGKALNTIYNKNNYVTKINDIKRKNNDDLTNCKFVNICIPFHNYDFFFESLTNLNLNKNAIIIIHSTIALETINKLQKHFENVLISSPVRGIHPNLVDGLLNFDKYIGLSDKYVNDDTVINKLINHFNSLQINTVICKSGESELAKIMSTTLYGMMISAVEDIGLICDHHGLDFDIVYTQWQKNYNITYEELGKSNVQRPILHRIPNKQKVIGGHCVTINSVILKDIEPRNVTNPMADFVLRYSNEKSRVHNSKKDGDDNDSRFN